MTKPHHILLIGGPSSPLKHLSAFLQQNQYVVELHEKKGEQNELNTDAPPDLILIDGSMPSFSITTLLSHLRQYPATSHTPISFMAPPNVPLEDKIAALEAGVDDWIVLPIEKAELLARIRAVLRRAQMQPKPELLAGIQSLLKKPAKEAKPGPPVPAPLGERDGGWEMPPSVPRPAASPFGSDRLVKRFVQVLHEPASVFSSLHPHQDFLLAVLLVFFTPLMASFAKLLQRAGDFDTWVGTLALGLLSNGLLWFGTAGLIQILVPFYGEHLSTKKALLYAGLGWAPRFVGGLMSFLYPVVALLGFTIDLKDFSAGIDLLPGIPSWKWVSFIGRIGIFDAWAAWITLGGVWTLARVKRQWDMVSILIGAVCLLFGSLTSF